MNKKRDFMNKQTTGNGQGAQQSAHDYNLNSKRTRHHTSELVIETPKVERDDGRTQDKPTSRSLAPKLYKLLVQVTHETTNEEAC